MGFCHRPVNVHANPLFLEFVLWPALSIFLQETKRNPSQMHAARGGPTPFSSFISCLLFIFSFFPPCFPSECFLVPFIDHFFLMASGEFQSLLWFCEQKFDMLLQENIPQWCTPFLPCRSLALVFSRSSFYLRAFSAAAPSGTLFGSALAYLGSFFPFDIPFCSLLSAMRRPCASRKLD
jgi:hypothetical protein